jgi:Cupin-like domain
MSLVKRPSADALARLRRAEARVAGRSRSRLKRIHRPKVSEVLRSMRSSTPLVMTGTLDAWAVSTWSFDRLHAEYGHVPLGLFGPRRTLGAFVDDVRNAPREHGGYTHGCPLPEALSVVFQPPLFPREAVRSQLWMGVGAEGRLTTRLHRDLTDTLLAQIIGTKRIVMYSPDQASNLYPFKNFNGHQQCWVDPSAPNVDRFPRFSDAQPVEVVLHPGQVLVNPTGWFHCVYATGETMSVSFALRPNARA